MLGTRPWRPRLVLSIATVATAYLVFAIVAHVVDPRWPPQAYRMDSTRSDDADVAGRVDRFSPCRWRHKIHCPEDGRTSLSGVGVSYAYTALVFAMLTVGNLWSGRRTRSRVAL